MAALLEPRHNRSVIGFLASGSPPTRLVVATFWVLLLRLHVLHPDMSGTERTIGGKWSKLDFMGEKKKPNYPVFGRGIPV